MVSFVNSIINAFEELPLIKRLHSLEEKIDNNFVLNEKIDLLKNKQKQMINAKEFNQWNQYAIYKKEYDNIYNDILEYPFVEEYLELLKEANEILGNISYIIENKINKTLNEC